MNFEYIPHKCSPHRYPRAPEEASVINNEIKKLLLKGVIIPTSIEKQDFFSNIFVIPKTDGTYWMILNLKALNFLLNVPHFKMESIHSVIRMVQHNSSTAPVDLKGCIHYIFTSLFCIPKRKDLQNKKNIFYFTSKALFILEIIKFKLFRYSNLMMPSSA